MYLIEFEIHMCIVFLCQISSKFQIICELDTTRNTWLTKVREENVLSQNYK